VLIVTTPEVSAVRDADRIIGLVEAAELGTPQLILNRIKPAMVQRGDMMSVEDVKDILAIEIIGIVPEDEQVVISTNRGESVVFELQSRAGIAYTNIARRLLGEVVPFQILDEPVVTHKPGFWARLFGLK
jgi:septum site-determining protein MinD